MKLRILPAAFSVLLLTGLGLVSIQPAGANEPKCTISGTARSEKINGTSGNDVICAGAGNDVVYGLGGNDIVIGGSGNDTIFGGEGSDDITGGTGNDIVDGGQLADSINGGQGNDKLLGGDGNDELSGSEGNDNLDGGLGRDELLGGTGTDNLVGGEDSDLIKGSSGTDSIQGGNGNDNIDGGSGRDTISTGSGEDNCTKDKTDIHLDSCILDNSAPQIGATTTYIREFQAGQVFTMSWNVSDSSGVEGSWASIGGRSGWVTSWCGFAIEAERVSGDEKNGTYQISCQAPELAVNETYTLFVSARDVLGNSTTYGSQFSFMIVGGSSDSSAPDFSEVELTKEASAGESVKLSLRVTDETSVKYVYGWLAYTGYNFSSFSTRELYAPALGPAELVDGDSQNGIYRQEFRFGSDVPAGAYTLWLSIGDTLGNKDFVKTDKLIVVR